MIVCETDRLRLLRLSLADAPFILELVNDPDFVSNIGDRGVRNLEDARRYILTGSMASHERFGFGLDRVELKSCARPIGICGLLRRDSHPDTELGYAFLPVGRGKGYAFEAARAAVDLGLRSHGLSRIVATTSLDNHGSIRVLEKLGFTFERLVTWTDPIRPSRLFALNAARQP